MQTPQRTPSLVLPFAVVGLAAGWLADGLLANPLVAAATYKSQGLAAVAAALAGAVLGAILTQLLASNSILRLSPLVIGAGVLTGALVGNFEDRAPMAALSGALNGAISGAAFIPVAALVLAAARRAARARQGSIVAGADRRAVWSILAAALSVMTLAAALDAPLARYDHVKSPLDVGVAMAGATALLVAAVLVADLLALARVSRLAGAAREPGEARDTARLPSIDLGLGAEVRAEVTRPRTAYRHGDQAVALLVGSVDEARSALGRAVARGVFGLAIAGAVLAGHHWAKTPAALVAYEEQRCTRSADACYRAGRILSRVELTCGGPVPWELGAEEQDARPLDAALGEVLLKKACDGGNYCGCAAHVQVLRNRAVEAAD